MEVLTSQSRTPTAIRVATTGSRGIEDPFLWTVRGCSVGTRTRHRVTSRYRGGSKYRGFAAGDRECCATRWCYPHAPRITKKRILAIVRPCPSHHRGFFATSSSSGDPRPAINGDRHRRRDHRGQPRRDRRPSDGRRRRHRGLHTQRPLLPPNRRLQTRDHRRSPPPRRLQERCNRSRRTAGRRLLECQGEFCVWVSLAVSGVRVFDVLDQTDGAAGGI